MTEKTFVTETGVVLRLKAVREPLVRARLRALEAEYRKDHPEMEVPTYRAETVAGDVQEIELDEDSLVNPGDPVATKINQARWRKHTAAKKEWAEIAVEQEYLTWLMLGVEVDLPDGWEAEIEAVGVNLPDDPLQRKACWLHFVALSLGDQQLLRGELQILSMGNVVKDDQVHSCRTSARGALERAARAGLDDALKAFAEGPLVGRPAVQRADDGESVGREDAERVGQPEQ